MSSTEEAIAQARKAVEPDKPKHVLRTLGKSIREYKKASLLAPALVAVEGILEILIPTIMASLIDEGITGGSMPSTIKFGVILLICAMVSLGAGFLSGKFAAIAGAGFAKNLRQDQFKKVQGFSFTNIDRFSTGSIVTRLTTDVTNLQNAYMMIIRLGVRAPIMVIVAWIFSFRISPSISLVFLACIPILAIGLCGLAVLVHPVFERVFHTYDALNNVVDENLQGIRVVKSYNRESFEVGKFGRISQRIFKDFTKADYYDRFPTIYHLRAYLMDTDEQADLRLVYLAIHNIVKHRGNFLRQGEKLTAKTAKTSDALKNLNGALKAWCESREYEFAKLDEPSVAKILADERSSRSQKAKDIQALVKVDTADAAANKKLAKALSNAVVGLQCEFKDVFGDFECEATKLAPSDDEKLEALQAACPDDCVELLESVCGVYSAYVLQGLLSYAEGRTISVNMIEKYNCYADDLDRLKTLVREYAPGSYESFFRGATYHDSNSDDPSRDYDAFKAQGYTAYDLHKLSYDDFAKSVKKLFAGTGAETDERYTAMMDAFDKQRFLRRLKTSCWRLWPVRAVKWAAVLRSCRPFSKTRVASIRSLRTRLRRSRAWSRSVSRTMWDR